MSAYASIIRGLLVVLDSHPTNECSLHRRGSYIAFMFRVLFITCYVTYVDIFLVPIQGPGAPRVLPTHAGTAVSVPSLETPSRASASGVLQEHAVREVQYTY